MRCRFKHKIFQNEENGYTIAIFTTQDTSVPLSARDKYLASRNIIGFSAIGFGLPLTDEIELEMEGRWESGEHGTQYQVENFMEVVPRTKEGILGYLSSGAVKGIGPKMADTIFRKFGLQTLEIMENNPQELLKIRGISEKKLAAIVESYGKNQVFRELMTFLAPFKVTPKKVNMILKKFGNESVDIIRHRPYMLSAVKGFGFLTVDAIGRQCCCALNDPMRISGCIGHIMNQAMKEGHLFKQRQEVIREALDISYPVVQGKDNAYYLHHLFSGESNINGSIFVDCHNQPDFTDQNTIVYGHNMKNGSMFGTLDKYQDQTLFEQHPEFYIYLPGKILKYRIFSCYAGRTGSEGYRYHFPEAEDFQIFLDTVSSYGDYDTGTELSVTDRIVTLSTCVNSRRNYRYLVHGKLSSEIITEE